MLLLDKFAYQVHNANNIDMALFFEYASPTAQINGNFLQDLGTKYGEVGLCIQNSHNFD